MPPYTPRCFIVRHGETEWSKTGRHTSETNLDLTENGKRRILATKEALVGANKLIIPSRLRAIYVSPMKRARQTLELLGLEDTKGIESTVLEDLKEYSYGDYEGITSADIRKDRKSRGLDKERDWDIWKDGCEGGESPEDVTKRVDKVIELIRRDHHGPAMDSNTENPCDVLLVAHGHILRALAMRWVGKQIQEGPSLLLEAGGIGTLSYEHHNIKEPAIQLGIQIE